MTRLIRMLGLAATAMIAGLCFAAPASAQATRTWISGVGDDVNPCSRTAPCKTWAGAISKTAAGGEIDCLDPGGFGSVSIIKSITLDCSEGTDGGAGGILNSGTTGIIINDPNGNVSPTVKVVLRNLTINGAGTTVGTYAVRFIGGKSLTMLNVSISNQGTGSVPAVSFEPVAGSTGARLVMRDVDITTTAATGISIKSVSGVPVSAVLDHVIVTDALIGLQAEDGATATIVNSNFSHNNGKGITAVSTALATPTTVNIDGVTVASNVNVGIAASANSTIRLSNSGVYNNAAGGLKAAPAAGALPAGVIQSFTNNRLGPDAGNTGLPTSSVLQK
ncbi:MAG: putative outer membrane protein [Sphingomonas bacterium]|jgi:hypothetical protein|nr:putative outer membrane protein [Sphingomonas bacterium]